MSVKYKHSVVNGILLKILFLMNTAVHHFMKKSLPDILFLSIIKFIDWIYNDSKFKCASGFHGKNIIIEKVCCESPDGKLIIIIPFIKLII